MRALTVLLLASVSALEGDGPAAADRAFAARAAEVGVNAAFLEVLAEDGTLFRPAPVAGRAWMEAHPDEGLLAWEPRVEWRSAAGDLGVTCGPWTYTQDERVQGAGHFLSVWTRVEGAWRLAADLGVSHAEPEPALEYAAFALAVEAAARELSSEAAEAELREAEALLDADTREAGALALLDRAHDSLLLLRPGAPPSRGPEAAEALLGRGADASRAELERVLVARSGDLAATWGALVGAGADAPRGGWLRVWHREDGAWRLLADVRLPAQ